jgi:thiol-disulfide isomerase/thioredoxin
VVYDETKEVLVAFVASWCKHCVKLVKVLEELAEKLPKVIFATIDAMENDIAD